MSDAAREELGAFRLWLKEALSVFGESPAAVDQWVESLRALPGDAGFRRYFVFGVASANRFIGAISPPATEKNHEFKAIAEHFSVHGVNVPEIINVDLERGFFLLQNLGKDLYLDHLNSHSADDLYRRAIEELIKIQKSPANLAVFSPYDRSCLRAEMQLFLDWFVPKLLGYAPSSKDIETVEECFLLLENEALQQPKAIVHRDYHSRNLVYSPNGASGVIDFQDAVVGPVTYDPVSLFRDCYIEWPESDVYRWLQDYQRLAEDAGVFRPVDPETFKRWFDWMGLQRHIKVLGIFARLFLRDNKPAYLHDLPLVIRYTRRVAARYTELAPFAAWFDQALMPFIRQQAWMNEGHS